MKRWRTTIAVILLLCVPIFWNRATGPDLLHDSDTRVLLAQLDSRVQSGESVLKWFSSDWPLQNHFYRPISTMVFELDRWLYQDRPEGYGATNACLVVLSLLALAWLIAETRNSRTIVATTVGVATLWMVGSTDWLAWASFALAAATLAASLMPGRDFRRGLMGALLWCFAGYESSAIVPLANRMIGWLPGRTASVMAFFGLISLAAYLRFLIQVSPFAPSQPPSSIEEPPSKDFQSPKRNGWGPYGWLALSWLALALALGSYEQAVMIPILHGFFTWMRRRQGHLASYRWLIGSFAVLGLYVLVRQSVIPPGISAYQRQQYWNSLGVVLSIADYVLPSFGHVRVAWVSVANTAYSLLFIGPWLALLALSSDVVAIFRSLVRSCEAGIFYLASCLAFLPMAWFKPFEHYHFFPMLLRAGMFVFVLELAITATISAASHPAIRVPQQPDLELG